MNRSMLGMAAIVVAGAGSMAQAYLPYGASPPANNYAPGAGLPTPAQVSGKEISFDADQGLGAVAPLLVPDAEQVLAWDGQAPLAGLAESFNFLGTVPNLTIPRQVDALSADQDALFFNALEDTAHLVYSVAPASVPSLSANPKPINPGALPQDIEYALRGAQGGTHGKWAVHRLDINSDPNDQEYDVDALEVWGGEKPVPLPGGADATKYSVQVDAGFGNGVSIWHYDQASNTSSSYVPLFGGISISDAVTDLLGPLPDSIDVDDVDLDALMVWDGGQIGFFDRTGVNPADVIIFSIRQLVDVNDPSGFYATGSELFVYDGDGAASWLFQGGHLWDKAWALDHMLAQLPGADGYFQLDIDALEAVSIPEPASMALFALGGAALLRRRGR